MAHPSPYDVFGEILLDAGGAAILQSLGSADPIPFMVGTAALALPPMAAPSLLEFVGTYMTLNDYVPQGFGVSRTNAEALLPQFAADMVFPEMISALAALNHFAHYPMESSSAIDTLRAALKPEARARLEAMLPHRQPFARQPVLRAMREVLAAPSRNVTPTMSPGIAPIMMVHAAGDALSHGTPTIAGTIGGWPELYVLDLVANGAFHAADDKWALMVRQATLWRSNGDRAAIHFAGKNACDLLVEASGLEPEDFLALGFGLAAHATGWTPKKPQLLWLDAGLSMDAAKVAAFDKLVCASPEEIASRFSAAARSTWDFLPLEATPVLSMPGGYLVLDESLLWARVTSGLYWIVFDHLKATSGEATALAWTRAWGDIVEAAVGDALARCAVPTLDGSPALWTEDDLHAAYGDDRKASDFVLDLGDWLVAVEVVSGRITTGTRIELARSAFDNDVERLVMKKLRQLDDTAQCLIESEEPLTGHRPASARKVLPVVVAAMGFPYIQPVVTHIEQLAIHEGLFTDGRVGPLCICDLRELELLEGAAAAGDSLAAILTAWRRETQGRRSFWDWATSRPGGAPPRPPRMRDEGTEVSNELRRRLGVQGDCGKPWAPDGPSD